MVSPETPTTPETEPQVSLDDVSAVLRAHAAASTPKPETESAEPEKPKGRQVVLDPGAVPAVETLKSTPPGWEPEPNLAFTPEYPAVLQGGVFRKYGEALQNATVSVAERAEYIRALIGKRDHFLDAVHHWDIPMLKIAGGPALKIRVRARNGYEEALQDEVMQDMLRSMTPDATILPSILKNLEVCCFIVTQVEQFNGDVPWKQLSFDPKRAGDVNLRAEDRAALRAAADELIVHSTPSQRKACVAALQMFEAMTLKCQAAVFDESF